MWYCTVPSWVSLIVHFRFLNDFIDYLVHSELLFRPLQLLVGRPSMWRSYVSKHLSFYQNSSESSSNKFSCGPKTFAFCFCFGELGAELGLVAGAGLGAASLGEALWPSTAAGGGRIFAEETEEGLDEDDEEDFADSAPVGPVPVHIHLGIDEPNGGNLLLA